MVELTLTSVVLVATTNESHSEKTEWSQIKSPNITPTGRGLLADKRAEAFLWLCENPGNDAEGLAEATGLSLIDSSDIIESLLNAGLLEFAE